MLYLIMAIIDFTAALWLSWSAGIRLKNGEIGWVVIDICFVIFDLIMARLMLGGYLKYARSNDK
jgi:hypothetical protein